MGSALSWHVLDIILDSWIVHGFPNSFLILHHMSYANGGNGLPGRVLIFPWPQAGQCCDQGALPVFPFCCHESMSRTSVFSLLCTLNFYWCCKKYQKVKPPTFVKLYPFLPELMFVWFPTEGQHCTYSSLHTLRKMVQMVLAGRRTSIMIPRFLFCSWICWVCFILFPLIWIYFPSMFAFPVDIIFSWFIFLNPLSSSSYLYSSPFSLYLFSFLSSDYFAVVKFPGFSSVLHPLWGTTHSWPHGGTPCVCPLPFRWHWLLPEVPGPPEPRWNGSTPGTLLKGCMEERGCQGAGFAGGIQGEGWSCPAAQSLYSQHRWQT